MKVVIDFAEEWHKNLFKKWFKQFEIIAVYDWNFLEVFFYVRFKISYTIKERKTFNSAGKGKLFIYINQMW